MANNYYLMELIKRRMAELGHDNYSLQSAALTIRESDPPKKEVRAYNEFYYLVSTSLPDNVVILSDTNYYKTKNHSSFGFNGVQEFSGHITMERGDATTNLDFVRVIVE